MYSVVVVLGELGVPQSERGRCATSLCVRGPAGWIQHFIEFVFSIVFDLRTPHDFTYTSDFITSVSGSVQRWRRSSWVWRDRERDRERQWEGGGGAKRWRSKNKRTVKINQKDINKIIIKHNIQLWFWEQLFWSQLRLTLHFVYVEDIVVGCDNTVVRMNLDYVFLFKRQLKTGKDRGVTLC